MYNFMMKESGFDLFALWSPCLRFSGANGLLLQEAMRIMLPMVGPTFLRFEACSQMLQQPPHTSSSQKNIMPNVSKNFALSLVSRNNNSSMKPLGITTSLLNRAHRAIVAEIDQIRAGQKDEEIKAKITGVPAPEQEEDTLVEEPRDITPEQVRLPTSLCYARNNFLGRMFPLMRLAPRHRTRHRKSSCQPLIPRRYNKIPRWYNKRTPRWTPLLYLRPPKPPW